MKQQFARATPDLFDLLDELLDVGSDLDVWNQTSSDHNTCLLPCVAAWRHLSREPRVSGGQLEISPSEALRDSRTGERSRRAVKESHK